MQATDRKAAVAAYKERKTIAGIYVVRCEGSGEQWVGHAPDLGAIRNRLWFTLTLGSNPNRGLQAAWQAHGAARFSFAVLESFAEEALPFARQATAKARLAHWRVELDADAI